jgi:hypothetical protein
MPDERHYMATQLAEILNSEILYTEEVAALARKTEPHSQD